MSRDVWKPMKEMLFMQPDEQVWIVSRETLLELLNDSEALCEILKSHHVCYRTVSDEVYHNNPTCYTCGPGWPCDTMKLAVHRLGNKGS